MPHPDANLPQHKWMPALPGYQRVHNPNANLFEYQRVRVLKGQK
jgi:hypothetical protein